MPTKRQYCKQTKLQTNFARIICKTKTLEISKRKPSVQRTPAERTWTFLCSKPDRLPGDIPHPWANSHPLGFPLEVACVRSYTTTTHPEPLHIFGIQSLHLSQPLHQARPRCFTSFGSDLRGRAENQNPKSVFIPKQACL